MDVSIVIAKFTEDISWSSQFKEKRIVYEKSDYQEIEGSKKLENIGRETDTYLNYIIDNYHNLPDWIIFTQGGPMGEYPNNLHVVNPNIREELSNLPEKYTIIDCFREIINRPEQIKSKGFLPLTHVHNDLYWDSETRTEFPEESRDFDKFNGYGIMNDCFLRHPFDGIYALLDIRVLYSYLFTDKIDSYNFNDGAIFAVHRDRIQFHPKKFYEKALLICNNPDLFGLSNNLTPDIDPSKVRKTIYDGYQSDNLHSMRTINNMPCCFERMWGIIFNGFTR